MTGEVLRGKRWVTPLVAVLTVSSLALGASAVGSNASTSATSKAKPIRLADATIIVEVNATDGDAGLQVFLDGEPWKRMKVFGPDGRKILDIKAKGRLKGHGLTELFSESSEPPFDELPLEEFKALFPEGTYRFRGRTIEGQKLVGKARLTHQIPDGPEIVFPEDGSTVGRANLIARWDPVTTPAGIKIVGYRVIVTSDSGKGLGGEFSAEVPAAQTSVSIPSEFLRPGAEYKIEVQVNETSGNQTLTEIAFQVE